MTSAHVRPSGTTVLRSRTARALAALALAVALVPATPTPARAAEFTCPSDEFVVEGFVYYDVTDVTTIADDQDTRDDFYDYILDDWYDGDEAYLTSDLGSTPEAREAKLTEWLIAEFIIEVEDEVFWGVPGGHLGRLGTASESPVRVTSTNNLMIGGRQYIRASIWTCSPTLVPALTTPIARLGTFEVVTDFTEPDVTCEATVFSPYAHFGNVNEIPLFAVPTRNYRTDDGTFAVGANAGDARDLALASAAAGAGSCTIGASSGPNDDEDDENGQLPVRVAATTQRWIPTAGAAPQLNPGAAAMQLADGTQLPLEMSSPAAGQVRYTADGVTVTLTGTSGTSATNGLVAAPTGEIACEVCVTAVSGEVIEVWMFSTPRLVAAHLVDDAECQVFAIPMSAPLDGGGPVQAGAHTLQLAIPTASGMQAIDVGVTVGGAVPASVPAGDGGLPRGGGLLAMSLALGAAALLSVRLGRREATDPTIG